MKKRSRYVALTIMGAAAFTLAGCKEEKVDAQAFPDLASCEQAAGAGGDFTAEQCRTAFAQAQELNVESAPRYDSLQVCEEQHGVGNCGSEEEATGHQGSGMGGIFMPLLAGYLIGNMLGGRGSAQPLYRNGQGGYTNADRSASFSTNNGKAKLSQGLFKKPATTIGKAPMTRATAVSRGGFGTSSSTSRSFGG
ncbi:DUF1190 domain-containing protein [Thioclava sp. GXIMD4216]|uniref:DUF1190 domain-containing protein n=1 Tax=Thioclava litoralis TaxID=3076557 RepID=A0ABZ1DYH2_9RHOB|nr:DUF1190 domain-containing protein [Thioclava sp. FTW29]